LPLKRPCRRVPEPGRVGWFAPDFCASELSDWSINAPLRRITVPEISGVAGTIDRTRNRTPYHGMLRGDQQARRPADANNSFPRLSRSRFTSCLCRRAHGNATAPVMERPDVGRSTSRAICPSHIDLPAAEGRIHLGSAGTRSPFSSVLRLIPVSQLAHAGRTTPISAARKSAHYGSVC
jgi:hypothetical protein